jgi:hypothetical protein
MSTLQLEGRTGVGFEMSPLEIAEIRLVTGPVLRSDDPWNFRTQQLRTESDFVVELAARVPVLDAFRLEYSGTAIPALTASEASRITQEIRVAFPVGLSGQCHVGTRVWWEDRDNPPPWVERTSVYFGVQFNR